MDARERVLTTFKRTGVPDRVPVQFDLCRSLLEAFGQKHDIPVRYTTSYFEDLTYRISANELRTAMGSDVVIVGGGLPSGYSHEVPEEGRFIDEFGLLMERGPLYMQAVGAPLSGTTSVQDVRDHPLPDPYAPGRFDDAREITARSKDDYAVVGDVEWGLFEMSWFLTGMEKFLFDMTMGEAYVEVLIDRLMGWSLGIAKQLVDVGVDVLWFGDDFGAQNGMLISPDMWRRIFKPRYAEMWQEVKAQNPDIIIAYHCDGAVAPILGDLADIGMQVFNPVQPNVPGHDPQELKDRFGDRFAFWGAIDQQALLPRGPARAIEADVAEKIEILGEGGGYLCSPAHIIQADVSVEHVEAFIEAVKNHGKYGG
jgi:uroporphyrinogen decarboxylase